MQAQIASYREYDQDPTDNDQCQKRVYMPANQYGSKRRARKNVNDGIELCNQFGKPDFFITLTANPLWADIQRQLEPGQTWADRPDIVNPIFKARLEMFLEKLRNGEFTSGAKQVGSAPRTWTPRLATCTCCFWLKATPSYAASTCTPEKWTVCFNSPTPTLST